MSLLPVVPPSRATRFSGDSPTTLLRAIEVRVTDELPLDGRLVRVVGIHAFEMPTPKTPERTTRVELRLANNTLLTLYADDIVEVARG